MSENNGKANEGDFLGSLWVTDDGRGGVKISGVINGVRVKLVKNKNKKDEASPSYYVFKVKSKGDKDVEF